MNKPGPEEEEVEKLVRAARARMDEMKESGAIKRDPYRHALEILVSTVSVFPSVVRAVMAARNPLTPEERAEFKAEIVAATRAGAEEGQRAEARYLGRRMDRKTAVHTGIAVGAAFAAGFGSCALLSYTLDMGRFGETSQAHAAWHQLEQDNPDPRPAMQAAGVRPDASGRPVYPGLWFWAGPSPSPRH